MLPTRASSGSAATPAPPMRLAWISVRREIRRLPFASPPGGAVRSPARAAFPPGRGEDGAVPGRRVAVPGGGGAISGFAGRGGATPAFAGRGGTIPGFAGRGGAPAGEACGAVPACGRREVPVPRADRDGGPDGVARGVPSFRDTRLGEPSWPARGAVPGSPGRCGLVRACPVAVP